MSLINDALKRARQTPQKEPPPGAPPLSPVESPGRGSSGWILALAAVLFLAAAGLFVGMALFKAGAPPVAVAKLPEVSAPQLAESVASPPSSEHILVSAPVSNASAALPGTNSTPAAATEPLPKVQGVIFNATHPVAIVNGKTVGIGDRVGNFQVKEVLQNSVVFQRPDGSQKTLAIGE